MLVKGATGEFEPKLCVSVLQLLYQAHPPLGDVLTISNPWGSFPWADGGLTARPLSASKPRDSVKSLFVRSEIWQTPQQQRWQDACRISERRDPYNMQSREFETSVCLVNKGSGSVRVRNGVRAKFSQHIYFFYLHVFIKLHANVILARIIRRYASLV